MNDPVIAADTGADDADPQALRAQMVDRVSERGWARTEAVADAMRTVARHAFVPATDLTDAYGDAAVITKRAADGAALSCASEPAIVAMMLDQLDVQPGQRILEIGAGTGYNAALLAHLTGPTGEVTTVDIDPEVTGGARRHLDATGHPHVRVVTRDGALGAPEHAPYDRIIVTVGAWQIPPAWWQQLAPAGRLVVPLRWRGQTRSVAFTRTGDDLISDSVELCGFVPMIGQDGEHTTALDPAGEITITYDHDQPIDPAALRNILDQPKHAAWSGSTVGGEEPFDGIWLRLTTAEPGTCRITAEQAAVDSGRCTPAIRHRSPALIDADSLAYLTIRRQADGVWELGAIGHGPAGDHLASRLCHHIQDWSRERTAQPEITASRATTAPDNAVIRKPHHTLTVQYASPAR